MGLPAHANVGGAGGLEGPMDMQDEKDRLRQEKKEQRKMEPFVLFGSSFPKDKEYTQVSLSFSVCVCTHAFIYLRFMYVLILSVQVCRNINQIKICMETGRTVILLNLENLYESLYDLLNQVCECAPNPSVGVDLAYVCVYRFHFQYYIMLSGIRYVDLGLQTHRVKCRVHENFK